ncbi:MAG: hypothetical protein JSR80_02165 [Verrucomicrobia bacterium]|nr:hypothetical protein [Verrucomicrobiota bacterium]
MHERYANLQNKIETLSENLPKIPQIPKLPQVTLPPIPPKPSAHSFNETLSSQTPPTIDSQPSPSPLTFHKVMSISLVVFAMSVASAGGLVLSRRWIRA